MVYVVDIEGYKSFLGIFVDCLVGSVDWEVLVIVINFLLILIMEGILLYIWFLVVENWLLEFVFGIFYYWRIGEKVWKKILFKYWIRGVFILILFVFEIMCQGIEYYILVLDFDNVFCYLGLVLVWNYMVVVIEVLGDDKFEVLMIKLICGKCMFWSCVLNVEMYCIYCSRIFNFKIGVDMFVMFVVGNIQSFVDNGFDFDGIFLKGIYYYCVIFVFFWDYESEVLKII